MPEQRQASPQRAEPQRGSLTIGDTPLAEPAPEGRGNAPKKKTAVAAAPPAPGQLAASPSFRKMKENLLKHLEVGEDVARERAEEMSLEGWLGEK